MEVALERRIRSQDIAESIRTEIVQKKLVHGSPIMSSRDISKCYKVSMLTANRALNRLVDENILYRVQGSGTYVKGAAGISRSLNIGYCEIITHDIDPGAHAAFGVLVDNCLAGFRKKNCAVKIIPYQDLIKRERAEKALQGLDGLLVNSSYIDEKTLPSFEAFKGPVTVYRNEFIGDWPFNQVIPDLATGMRETVRRIDREKISGVIVVSSHHLNADARVREFVRQAESAGIARNKIDIINVDLQIGDNGRMCGYRTGQKLLSGCRGKFIFCTSDFIAFGLIDAMHENGIVPGKDVQLVSYDNLEGYGMIPYEHPIITSVDFPKDEVARRAAELTIMQIEKNDNCLHIIKVPTHLVIRETGLQD
ncbi:MAG: LacI family DNA-binding transcriptional regulator [Victivallaceae bacterium]|jgi:DNA-binding LacI/PurR family transcriptional regulator